MVSRGYILISDDMIRITKFIDRIEQVDILACNKESEEKKLEQSELTTGCKK